MKRNSVFFISIITIFFSCKEIGPIINTSGNGGNNNGGGVVDSTQQKNVLLESFTGTNCPNCPKGRIIIDDLLAAHAGRIEVVELHEGFYSVPLINGDPDLKTEDGLALELYLGPAGFWPCAAIDRKLWDVSSNRLLDRNQWTGIVNQELDSTLKILMGLNFIFDNVTRKLSGTVTVDFLYTITDALNITVLITESGIVAGQLDVLTVIPDYVHHDVLRDVITTNYLGDIVSGSKLQGSSWNYNLSPYTVDDTWNVDSCRVIAFVSKSVGTYDVLQAIGAPLK